MPTTIAQMGSVAKTQARGQQNAQQVTPFSEQQEKSEDLKVQRVKETKEAQQERIDPDEEKKDRRKRRRMKRNRKFLAAEEVESKEEENADEEQLGGLIDLRV